MAQETLSVQAWICGLLSEDAALAALVGTRVYPDLAPQGAVYPLVVIGLQASTDIRTFRGDRALNRALWLVKAIGKGSSAFALQPIVDRIDTLLQLAATVQDDLNLRCTRTQAIQYPEEDQGVRYYHVGGLWRVYAS